MSKKKAYSNFVAQFCFVTIVLLCFGKCFGQDVAWVSKPYKTGWNNAAWFQAQPKEKFLDWQNIGMSWDGKQLTAWGALALSGVAHGMREAYHADPYIFEDSWNANPDGFWGSDAWKRNYHNNDPKQGHKAEYFANFGRDVWHTADEVDVFGLSLSSIGTGMRKQPWKYRLANFAIGMGIRTLFARVTYETLR